MSAISRTVSRAPVRGGSSTTTSKYSLLCANSRTPLPNPRRSGYLPDALRRAFLIASSMDWAKSSYPPRLRKIGRVGGKSFRSRRRGPEPAPFPEGLPSEERSQSMQGSADNLPGKNLRNGKRVSSREIRKQVAGKVYDTRASPHTLRIVALRPT